MTLHRLLCLIFVFLISAPGSARGQSVTDTDGDGLPDAWETQFGLNASSAGVGASGDPDGDGVTNLAEYQSGTDPILSNVSNPYLPREVDPWSLLSAC